MKAIELAVAQFEFALKGRGFSRAVNRCTTIQLAAMLFDCHPEQAFFAPRGACPELAEGIWGAARCVALFATQ
jgi:hypothetical protein